jgi:uncharacterized protein YlxW (UPF0749 family)
VTDARGLQKGLALTLPALLFGFFVATQWSTFAVPGSGRVSIRYIDPLSATVTRLQDEQTGLRTQLADLRTKLDDLQRASSQQSGAAKDLQARLDDLRASAGMAEVRGEGVVVTLDATRATSGEVRQPCFAPDLTDIVNATWRAGATAVAINGERLVASSSVYCVGGTIVVNGRIASAPFSVSAVGPAGAILALIDDPAQLRDLKRRRDQQAVDLRVSRSPLITVPAFAGVVTVRSARPQ